ncbi:putative bifunctional diguanylate cyclase/phosphodiesterase [Aureimonas pseudogalii]|uniref:Diguanylate cyclase (GGDEF)-like protein n=1 Tax=Aureimonas pseudogalii TaxID=1744844 RepID=A0A7W6H4G2_9HYPH|nr:bifunctional diguanylate cyclase/phosphodiesterase [Aureimonas pseudogalii]MBB3998193.1 diguanylate cyclase (GGDEF)-like protein [Aureimonas pseudogalii]
MLLKLLRRYGLTMLGAGAVLATIAGSGVYLGRVAIDELIDGNVQEIGRHFASFVVADPDALGTLLTQISRSPDEEARVRNVADASGISSFAIFDLEGEQVFASRSDRYTWLMRERPGGTISQDKLGAALVERAGDWTEVKDLETDMPVVIVPLDRDGQRFGFLSVQTSTASIRAVYTSVIATSVGVLFLVVFVSTGLPGLIYLQRRWRIEQADEQIQFLANYDSLTHLLNRHRMQEECEKVLATSRATREQMAFWSLDIAGLADINSAQGQPFGDELLRVVAKRLLTVADPSDLVARLGADDFLILQRRVADSDDIEALAQRIRQSVELPVEFDGRVVTPHLCMGVVNMPEHGRVFNDIARHAELALMVHKSSRQGAYTAYDPSMDEEAHRRRMIEGLIRTAIDCDGFELFYQPIVCGKSRRPIGFEALIRLPDGKGNYISPGDFIPFAEARGYIKAIGSWVIRQAARQLADLPEDLFISVNLSAVQFRDGDLVDIVRGAIEQAGIDGRRLEIEVVESLLLERSDAILDQLSQLKGLGVSIAMDDFGTGYSSLGYLWRFPFDKLKIDQSFMLAFGEGEANVSQIIETIISLGHHMNMKVTVEGVETFEQVSALSLMGCDQLQGYYFGRPMPIDRIASEMLQQTSRRVLVDAVDPVSPEPLRAAL